MKNVFLFFALCGFASAMVPRTERAQKVEVSDHALRESSADETSTMPSTMSTDEIALATSLPSELTTMKTSSPKEPSKTICAPQTPCAWAVYKPVYRIIEENITNHYCVCASDLACVVTEDDMTASAYIYRCRVPPSNEPSLAENEAHT